jgi:hypothetical protein
MMDQRPDGRKYAKVTRRSKAILECLPDAELLAVPDAIDRILERQKQEFFLPRYGRTISPGRLRVYLRFLDQLGAVHIGEGQIQRTFRLPSSDGQWAQSLADHARKALGVLLKTDASNVPDLLVERAKGLLQAGKVPTVDQMISVLEDTENTATEFMRWNIYLVCDGARARIEIRRTATVWVV